MITIPEEYWTGAHTVKFRLPYLTPQSIYRIDGLLKPYFKVLEFGAGGSTLFFANRCNHVLSVEPSQSWIDLLIKESEVCKLRNIRFHLYKDREDMTSLLNTIDDKSIDILLVDSDDYLFGDLDYEDVNKQPTSRSRSIISELFISKLKLDGIYILDNYSRPWYKIPFLNNDEWNIERYNDPHWDGEGTLIAYRKNIL